MREPRQRKKCLPLFAMMLLRARQVRALPRPAIIFARALSHKKVCVLLRHCHGAHCRRTLPRQPTSRTTSSLTKSPLMRTAAHTRTSSSPRSAGSSVLLCVSSMQADDFPFAADKLVDASKAPNFNLSDLTVIPNAITPEQEKVSMAALVHGTCHSLTVRHWWLSLSSPSLVCATRTRIGSHVLTCSV